MDQFPRLFPDVCCYEVSRSGHTGQCGRPAVAVARWRDEDGHQHDPFPICAYHAHRHDYALSLRETIDLLDTTRPPQHAPQVDAVLQLITQLQSFNAFEDLPGVEEATKTEEWAQGAEEAIGQTIIWLQAALADPSSVHRRHEHDQQVCDPWAAARQHTTKEASSDGR